jgi:glycine/D-amino acid oxidase-like deaminating enzyme
LQNYRFTILGAGLAGLSLSAVFSHRSIPHVLIDTSLVGSGASGTPAGLLNPAAAQKARFQTSAPSCMDAFVQLFDIVSRTKDCSSVILSPHILRPAMDQTLASNFRKSIEKGGWPNHWVNWLNESEVMSYGNIPSSGGMFINRGLAVDIRAWTKLLCEYTTSEYASVIQNTDYELERTGLGYFISTSSVAINSEIIIDCTGSSNRFKSHLRWHSVKGQTRVVQPRQSVNLKTAVSGYGYVVKRNHELILGSTYEHLFTDDRASVDKDEYLLGKAAMVTDEKLESDQITERWAGIRVSTPDRLPAIGSLPMEPNFHFIVGLGSKGLYYSAWVANLLADHLLHEKVIPAEYQVLRLLNHGK